MNKKPLVLIPVENPPKTYLCALEKVGLDFCTEFSSKSLSRYSGLLLTGGGDVLSAFYRSTVKCRNVNVLRDVNEFKILEYFFSKQIPILAVCRGMQLLNVFLGGSLKTVNRHQGEKKEDVFHSLSSSDGYLRGLVTVNSNHVQCIDKPCSIATDAVYSADNVLEAFSVNSNVLAVQFHPERMDDKAIFTVYGKFATLVNAYFKSSR